MNNRDMVFLVVGVIIGAAFGGFVGSRWQEWVDSGVEWLIAICAAVGLIVLLVGGFALASGWRP